MNPRSGFNQQQSDLWRPWIRTETTASALRAPFNPAETQPKPALFIHPVKLYWPKTKCFDYLYREAEMLLRNYPVQATICPCEDSSSSEDDSEEEEEDDYDDDDDDDDDDDYENDDEIEMAKELN